MNNLTNPNNNEIQVSKGNDPFSFLSPITSLREEMNNLFGKFNSLFSNKEIFLDTIFPPVDIIDDNKEFKLEVELPGLDENDIKVNIYDNDMLVIRAEKQASKKDKGRNYITHEISYGSYERTIRLPDSVDQSQVKASFKKGMLWVTIPKKEGYVKHVNNIKIEKMEA